MKTGAEIVAELESGALERVQIVHYIHWPTIRAALLAYEPAAAPALYEALKAARRALVSAITANVELSDFDVSEHVVIKQIDAALAPAEGREPPEREEYPDHGPTDPWRTSGPGGAR